MSSRPPKMSSQTDLGGRPPKFGRTMAALRHTITVDTWRRMRQVIYKDFHINAVSVKSFAINSKLVRHQRTHTLVKHQRTH